MRQDMIGYSLLLALIALIALGLVNGAQTEPRDSTSSMTTGALTGATGAHR